MCGRYRLHAAPGVLHDWAELRVNPLPNIRPRWNIAPTQDAPVIRRHPETGARHLDELRWGLVPHWAKDATGGARMINARAETVATLPAFRDGFAKRRCLVPADGFYEWHGEKPPKQPYTVAMASGAPMMFAGLWSGWRAPNGEVLRSFTICTTEANARLRPLHHRMPVILPRAAWAAWLGEGDASAAELQALLRPCPDDWVTAWPVSRRVGKVSEDDAGLVERDASVEPVAGLDG
jgi:putative SOS response-associated peptidase YedK